MPPENRRPSRPGAWRLVAFALAGLHLVGGAAFAEDKRWFEGGDKVFVRQHEDFVRIQEPDVHLQRAHRRFAKGIKAGAADELEKAAAGFAYFAQRSAGADRKELTLASRALNKLADQVRRGEIDEITTLERAIADAKRILAGEPAQSAEPAAPPK
jgi:hypothetical protein